MNWFTQKSFPNASKVGEDVDLCEHLEINPNQKTTVSYENDSFGRVGGFAMCPICVNEERRKIDESIQYCVDCGNDTQACDGINWTPFDYNPQMGDTPTFICDHCIDSDKHKGRVEQDTINYQFEYPDQEDFGD